MELKKRKPTKDSDNDFLVIKDPLEKNYVTLVRRKVPPPPSTTEKKKKKEEEDSACKECVWVYAYFIFVFWVVGYFSVTRV